MFHYTSVFISPTRFVHFCDHLQGILEHEYKQYTSDYTQNAYEDPARLLSTQYSETLL
jgi:hypothetical protein